MTFRIEAKGIDTATAYLRRQPKRTQRAMYLAAVSATRRAYTLSRRAILDQVAFKSSYLTSSEGGSPRFSVARRPTPDNPTGVIRGRVRGTSLNRFVTSALTKRTNLRARIKAKGASRKLGRAFRINLKNGNRGVAVRVPKGEKPQFGKGQLYGGASNQKTDLYLLYGPSVQQVFTTVAPDVAPEVSDYLGGEFIRQFERLR